MLLTPIEENFLEESNRIEGIHRAVLGRERKAFKHFIKLETLTLMAVCDLVEAFQPDARLRNKEGLNVRVGNHFPPHGGIGISYALVELLEKINEGTIGAYDAHVEYETLHPFTDGNGRSGRMLWWRMMNGSALGFLHKWYYQSLDAGRRE